MSRTQNMMALILDGPHRLRLAEVPRPVPGEGEVLIRVHHATICGTDLRIVDGRKTRDIRYGYPIGHECGGTVEQIGPGVTGYVPGERVSVCVVVSCGECRECREDRENLCASRVTLGYHTAGAFAEYMLIPAQAIRRGNLVKLPSDVPFELAPLLEPMGCCINGIREMCGGDVPTPGTAAGRSLAILGAGPIGLLHLKLARAYGGHSRIFMTEPLPHRQAMARAHGADEVLDPDEFDACGTFDDVILAFGDPALVSVAMRAAGKSGRISLFAGFDKDARLSFDPNLVHYHQLRLTGGSESRRRDYREAMSLVKQGRVDLSGLVTHWFSLPDYELAFQAAAQRTGAKIGFRPSN